jgi:hypothetical protein
VQAVSHRSYACDFRKDSEGSQGVPTLTGLFTILKGYPGTQPLHVLVHKRGATSSCHRQVHLSVQLCENQGGKGVAPDSSHTQRHLLQTIRDDHPHAPTVLTRPLVGSNAKLCAASLSGTSERGMGAIHAGTSK